MSTFYDDGYRDGMQPAKYNPPLHPGTDVFEQEYRQGYEDGKRLRELVLDEHKTA